MPDPTIRSSGKSAPAQTNFSLAPLARHCYVVPRRGSCRPSTSLEEQTLLWRRAHNTSGPPGGVGARTTRRCETSYREPRPPANAGRARRRRVRVSLKGRRGLRRRSTSASHVRKTHERPETLTNRSNREAVAEVD